MDLKEFRTQFPQYNDMTDNALADALYNTHYSDMPREEFNKKINYTPVGAAQDIAKTAIPSLGRGVSSLVGAPHALATLAGAGADYLPNALGGSAIRRGAEFVKEYTPEGQHIQEKYISPVTGDYKPQTTAGRYAGSALEFLPSAAIPAGSLGLGARAAMALMGGVGSEAGGDVAEAAGAPRWTGNLVGGVAGAYGLPKLTKAPSMAGPEAQKRIRQAGVLEESGMPVTAGQYTGNPFLLQREANLMTPKRATAESQAYTKAVGSKAGMPSGILDTEAFQEGLAGVKASNKKIATTDLTAPNFGQLQADLRSFKLKAQPNVSPETFQDINDIISKVKRDPRATSMPGSRYQSLTGELQSLIEKAKSTPDREALSELRRSLHDAMGKEFAPGELEAMRNRAVSYGTLHGAAPFEGGQVTPPVLQKAIGQGNLGHPLQPIAEAGSTVLGRPEAKEPGRVVRGLGGLLGLALGKSINPEVANAASEAFVPAIFFREAAPDIFGMATRNPVTRGAYFNPATQHYLKYGVPGANRLFKPEDQNAAAMIRALMGPESARLQPEGTPSGIPAVGAQPYPIK